MTHFAALACTTIAFSQADRVPPEIEIVPAVGPAAKVAKFAWKADVVYGTEHLGKGDRRTWSLPDLLQIRFPTPPAPAANGMRAWTTVGDALVLSQIKSMSEEKVEVRGAAFGDWALPPARLRGLVLDAQATAATAEKVRQWLERPRTADAVLYRNFDEATGTLVSVDDKAVVWKSEAAERRAPRDQILAVAFDPQLAEKDVSPGVFVALGLADGSTLRIRDVDWPADGVRTVKAKSLFGDALEINLDAVAGAAVRNGKAVFASDLKPLRTVVAPYLDGGRKVALDRNAQGGPLRLGGRTYEKGLGVVSRSSVVYAAREWKRFDAEVGLDDAAGPLGSVRFLVRVDGAVAFDSGEMRPGDKPKSVGVALDGKKEIELTVDFEKRGDVDDLADWGEARFLR